MTQCQAERQETARGTQLVNKFTARPFLRYAMVWKTGRMRCSIALKPQSVALWLLKPDRVNLWKRCRRDPFLKLFSVNRHSVVLGNSSPV